VDRHNKGLNLAWDGLRLRGREFRGLGGWQGKPLHPSLASVAIGTTVAAVVFDVASALSAGPPSLGRELYRSATFVLMLGQFFIGLAVLTGWWDRRRLTVKATMIRGAANAHAWVMVLFGGLSFCDILIRRGLYPDAEQPPALVLAVTLATGILALVGGTLGGALTFEDGLAVEDQGSRASTRSSAT
jgi:uncharacterized membrane protein